VTQPRVTCYRVGIRMDEPRVPVGVVAYDPEPLDPPANGDALICCCRPRGEVILDL